MTTSKPLSRLRPAEIEDVPRLKQLGVLGWETTYSDFVSPENRRAYLTSPFWSLDRLNAIVTDPNCLTLVAESTEHQVAGFLTIEPLEDGGVELTRFYVDPDIRGAGIGVTLFNEGLAWGRERGADTMLVNVFADNTGGRRFYERVGFVLTRLEPCAVGDQIVGDAWYELSLRNTQPGVEEHTEPNAKR